MSKKLLTQSPLTLLFLNGYIKLNFPMIYLNGFPKFMSNQRGFVFEGYGHSRFKIGGRVFFKEEENDAE